MLLTVNFMLELTYLNIGHKNVNEIPTFYFVVISWLLLPYLVMGVILGIHAKRIPRMVGLDCLFIILISAAGLYLLISNIYFSKDAQSPIAILFFPIYQLAGFLILNAVSSGKRRNISG
ncbi:MAG: hypothetical protein ACYC69_18055 [Thermodesulfovibrionales bacterium]